MSLPEKQNRQTYDFPTTQPSKQEPQLEEMVSVAVPQNRLKKVSKLEKLVFLAFIVTFISLSVATIKLTTAINREEEAISVVQTNLKDSEKAIDKLEQEKNELLNAKRVKGIAEAAGIELREDNIRKIK